MQVNKIMKQLKQILKERMRDINQVKQNRLMSNGKEYKFHTISNLKKAQKVRAIKQGELINSLNYYFLRTNHYIQQFYSTSVEICASFDHSYENLRMDNPNKMNISRLYVSLFNQFGFNHKSEELINLLKYNQLDMLSPSIFFTWLSQLSRKIYTDIIQSEINTQFMQKNKLVDEIRGAKININNHKTSLPYSYHLDIKPKFQTQSMNKKKSIIPIIILNNKENVYSYFLQQLYGYYKAMSILEVDFGFLRSIKKQGKKQDIFHLSNINKVIDILVSSNSNNLAKITISQYSECVQKKNKKKKLKFKTNDEINENNTHEELRIQLENNAQSQNLQVVGSVDNQFQYGSLYPYKMPKSRSKLFSPKVQNIQMFQEERITHSKHVKIIKAFNAKKYNMQFPIIRASLSSNASKQISFLSNGREKCFNPELNQILKYEPCFLNGYKNSKRQTENNSRNSKCKQSSFDQDIFRSQLKQALRLNLKKQQKPNFPKKFSIKQLINSKAHQYVSK